MIKLNQISILVDLVEHQTPDFSN